MSIENLFGYFTDDSEVPTYDPGLNHSCFLCFKPLTDKARMTISFGVPRDDKAYFYRVHKDCYNHLSQEEISEYEGVIVDKIIEKLKNNWWTR